MTELLWRLTLGVPIVLLSISLHWFGATQGWAFLGRNTFALVVGLPVVLLWFRYVEGRKRAWERKHSSNRI